MNTSMNRRHALRLATAVAAGSVALPAPTAAAPIFQPAPFAAELGGYVAYETADLPEPGALDFLAPEE